MELREFVARALCEAASANWDAKDHNETANGETPEEQREYWLEITDQALASADQYRRERMPLEGRKPVRQRYYYVIPMPVNEKGQGPASFGVDTVAGMTYEVWDQLCLSHASFELLPDALEEAERLNEQFELSEQPKDARYWFTCAWSARKRSDGTFEPDRPISGTGVGPKNRTFSPEDGRQQARFWLEEYGRCGKGDPLFFLNAPFELDVPEPRAEGDASET